MRREKRYNEPHTIHDLVDDLRKYFGYNFSEQEGCYVIKKILDIKPTIKGYCYNYQDYARARDFNKKYVNEYITNLEWHKEPMTVYEPEDSNMEKVSKKLLDRDIYDFKYESKGTKIIMTESQFKRIFKENNLL